MIPSSFAADTGPNAPHFVMLSVSEACNRTMWNGSVQARGDSMLDSIIRRPYY